MTGQHLKESVAQCMYKVHVTEQEGCNVAPSSFVPRGKGPSQIGLVREATSIVIINVPGVVETRTPAGVRLAGRTEHGSRFPILPLYTRRYRHSTRRHPDILSVDFFCLLIRSIR